MTLEELLVSWVSEWWMFVLNLAPFTSILSLIFTFVDLDAQCTICVCMYVGPRAETVLAEASQHRDRAEFQLGKLKEATSLQKQDLEYQLQARADEIEHLKVRANNHWYPYAGLYLKFRYLGYLYT